MQFDLEAGDLIPLPGRAIFIEHIALQMRCILVVPQHFGAKSDDGIDHESGETREKANRDTGFGPCPD